MIRWIHLQHSNAWNHWRRSVCSIDVFQGIFQTIRYLQQSAKFAPCFHLNSSFKESCNFVRKFKICSTLLIGISYLRSFRYLQYHVAMKAVLNKANNRRGSKYFQDRGTDFPVLHNVLSVTKHSTHRNIVSICFKTVCWDVKHLADNDQLSQSRTEQFGRSMTQKIETTRLPSAPRR